MLVECGRLALAGVAEIQEKEVAPLASDVLEFLRRSISAMVFRTEEAVFVYER
jgi:hypothetical protein